MPDDQNTPPNTPTTDSSPTMPSDTPETAPEAQNAPTDGFSAESNNSAINKGDAETALPENEPKSPENQDSPSAESKSKLWPSSCSPLPRLVKWSQILPFSL